MYMLQRQQAYLIRYRSLRITARLSHHGGYSNKAIEFSSGEHLSIGDSSIITIWTNKSLLLSDLHRYDETVKCFDKIIELDPNYSYVWAAKGRVLNGLPRYDEPSYH